MSMDHRDRMIEKFTHDPDVRVFLMSLKAGGVALNLTAASHVMLMDPWWVALSFLITVIIVTVVIIIIIIIIIIILMMIIIIIIIITIINITFQLMDPWWVTLSLSPA